MIQNFEINSNQIDKIKKISTEEKNFRIKNLELFKSAGFPNKRLEDWKFSDFKNIIDNNFDELDAKNVSHDSKKINLLKNFDHNYIFLVNGNLYLSNFEYEEMEVLQRQDKSKHQSLQSIYQTPGKSAFALHMPNQPVPLSF